MKLKKRALLTQEEIKYKNIFSEANVAAIVERACYVIQDKEKRKRIKECLCVLCYYNKGNEVAGRAITTVNCRICDQDMMFSSTNTDQTCQPCAVKHKLCKHCGADIQYKNRRKRQIKESEDAK